MEQNMQLQQPKLKKRKIITAVIFIIIFLAIVYWGWTEYNQWWQVRKEYVRMGLAENKFPYRMYTERELVEKGIWTSESPALKAVPTRTTPEETYAKFRQALIDGDLDKAAECFVREYREEWKKSLYEIKEKEFLKDMVKDLPRKLEDTYLYTDDITGENTRNRNLNNIAISSYIYVLENDSQRIAHTISFEKNWDGDWLIKDL